MRNGGPRFRWAVVEGLRLRVGDFGCGGLQSDRAFRVTDMIPDLGVFGMGSSEKVRRGEKSVMDSRICGCQGKNSW